MEFKTLLTSATIVALSAGFASAQDDSILAVDGDVIKTRAAAPAFAEKKKQQFWLNHKVHQKHTDLQGHY